VANKKGTASSLICGGNSTDVAPPQKEDVANESLRVGSNPASLAKVSVLSICNNAENGGTCNWHFVFLEVCWFAQA